MPDVLERIGSLPAVRRLPDLLAANGEARVIGAAGSGPALIAAWLMGSVRTPVLAVCATAEEAEEFAEDVNLFADGLACHFPALEVLPGDEDDEPNEIILKARLAALRHLAFGPEAEQDTSAEFAGYLEPTPRTRLVATNVRALLQPTCAADDLRQGSRAIERGEHVEPHALTAWLVEHDYLGVPQVEEPGQFSLRGGILDIYSHGAPRPVRIEFFGDEVESIRGFDPVTQRSTERMDRCRVAMSERLSMEGRRAGRASLISYLPDDALVFVTDPDRVWGRALEVFGQSEHGELLAAPGRVRQMVASFAQVAFHEGQEAEDPNAVAVRILQRDSFGPDLEGTVAELGRIAARYAETVIYCISQAEAERFRSLLADRGFERLDSLRFEVGRLNHGAICEEAGMALIPHHRLFGRYRQRRVIRHGREGRPLDSAEELRPGDLVVHVNHGIARFLGTSVMEKDGTRRDYLQLQFADDVQVHVPCDRIEMVHRYIGAGAAAPELSKIRSAGWWKARKRAQEAVEDLAAELLELQAVRETQQGVAFPEDTEWQQQFESEFPYEETEDQLRAIHDVRDDMCAPRPMDRLVCGDVGYGKTEVAMRAAFRAVMGGRQVAVLVPTTILAQQHFHTFSERMADYPIRIEMLSRFLTGSETKKVVEDLAGGEVDIVIGTHRLIQDDIAPKDLGLLIIDEEQRFGVEHKEKLKAARATVDVLTLTATPIPRTLHMAMMGLREISSLQTPPRDRQAIETRVSRFSSDLLRHAVLRELNRDGQVFIIHNRVQTIEAFADRARGIVPEARVAVAHGQMHEHELSDTMEAFMGGDIDVLVSTTIVESGLDIPNANTIILDRCDLLGLAEMHQLRGRVGRYIHKAYAYFFVPADRPVTPEARSRLDAIRRYSQLGAGFDIALRDLEIRGAGNILGPAQSGHIAAVGYNLYCQLLAQAVRGRKGEQIKEPLNVVMDIGLDALLPEDYVALPRQRMDIYRQVHRATEPGDVREVEAGMRDRFGEPPREARNLLSEAEIRIRAAEAGIYSIHVRDGRIHLGIRDWGRLGNRFRGAARRPRKVDAQLAVIDDGFPRNDPEGVADFLLDLLRRP
jgi:transcription-repair coupling factor (superfamily II helicase)